jgi:hypothetical protein
MHVKVPYSGRSRFSTFLEHLKSERPSIWNLLLYIHTQTWEQKVVSFGGGSSEHGLSILCLNCASLGHVSCNNKRNVSKWE